MNSVGIIIQARMGSSRLPGKVMKKVGTKILLEQILTRVNSLLYPVYVVVATSLESRDSIIADYCDINNYDCFRGDELDVLARYYACAKKYGFTHVVRLTADNPLTDIAELDRLIELHIRDENDYTHSFGRLPLGVGAEIFTLEALERSYHEGHKGNHREHVNEYIQENPDKFRIGELDIPTAKIAPTTRLTIDTPEDYQRLCSLIENYRDGINVSTEQAINFCTDSV